LITKEINIDLIDFIYPAEIDITLFRQMWAKYEWENRIMINTNITNIAEYVKHLETTFKLKMLLDEQSI